MYKSVFIIKKMDCPCEKSLIETKLSGLNSIIKLDFDLPKRRLEIIHNKKDKRIKELIDELNLNSTLKETKKIDNTKIDFKKLKQDEESQKKLLKTVLYINFGFFLFEIIAGVIANSMGLVADSLDMFSDSVVYAISLFAIGGSLLLKKKVAKIAGYFQIILAVLGFLEVIRRFLGFELMPDFRAMIIVSIFSFIANMYCLYLFSKNKSDDAHMKASSIFTSNDLIVNTGVILSGVLVYLFNSNKPDLIIGSVVFIVVIRGAIQILKLGK